MNIHEDQGTVTHTHAHTHTYAHRVSAHKKKYTARIRKPHTSTLICFGHIPRKSCFHLLPFSHPERLSLKSFWSRDLLPLLSHSLQYEIDPESLFPGVQFLPLSIFSPGIANYDNTALPKFIYQSSVSFPPCRQICLYTHIPVTENIWTDSFCCSSSESTVCLNLANETLKLDS